ncbi:hypothetical protein ACEUBT_02295 [Aeromonas bivalvium]
MVDDVDGLPVLFGKGVVLMFIVFRYSVKGVLLKNDKFRADIGG